MGFGLVIAFTDLIQNITTTKDYVVTVLNTLQFTRAVFLNHQAAAWSRASASIIPGHERFSWNLLF
jgi:hypothetical protein